jgi:hypothetical protein
VERASLARPTGLVGGIPWWGEAPERLCDFDEGAGLLSPNIWLHQHARGAAVYRVAKVKRMVWPIHATISGAKPTD